MIYVPILKNFAVKGNWVIFVHAVDFVYVICVSFKNISVELLIFQLFINLSDIL